MRRRYIPGSLFLAASFIKFRFIDNKKPTPLLILGGTLIFLYVWIFFLALKKKIKIIEAKHQTYILIAWVVGPAHQTYILIAWVVGPAPI